MPDYSWQLDVYARWKEHGYKGIVKASTGAGKTRGAIKTLQQFRNDFPFESILIVTPSSKLNAMWEDELRRAQLDNWQVFTYQTAVNKMLRGGLRCDCMVCDECHRLATPVQGRVLEMNPKYVLGLSATPEGSVRILGEPIIEIGIDEANLCDFLVHYVSFPASDEEYNEYNALSNKMRKRALKVTNGAQYYLPPGRDSYGWDSYDALVRKRRDVSYKFASRIPYTVALVKKHLAEDIVIFTERRETASAIIKALASEEIYAVGDSNVQAYESGKSKILVLTGKLREGWNCPSTSVVILSSVNTRVIKNVQTIGRALRVDPNNPDKRAHIYMLMAENTSDTSVIKSTSSYYKGHYVVTDIKRELNGGYFA